MALAVMAVQAGAGAIVCSPQEVAAIRAAQMGFKTAVVERENLAAQLDLEIDGDVGVVRGLFMSGHGSLTVSG